MTDDTRRALEFIQEVVDWDEDYHHYETILRALEQPQLSAEQWALVYQSSGKKEEHALAMVELCRGPNGIKSLAGQWQYEADQWNAIATAIRQARKTVPPTDHL